MAQIIEVEAYGGRDVTARATAPVTAGRLVTVSSAPVEGNIAVRAAGAGEAVFGVARATVAAGELVPVTRGASRIVRLIAGATVAVNAVVESDVNGAVVTAMTGTPVGRAVSAAAAGNEVLVSLHA
ncbi:capsid cement protein [Rhodococcus sp. B50]|uniref:capsid cement protein n=1 Tax=Rhodococcus sp. B50 TaxID=2682847 RepID=UPI001BD2A473|nr:capsid cement protein [Rhodococcus sp. B50]MBS9373614.1 hypothetical protein [Rhodococcus sp. B50]